MYNVMEDDFDIRRSGCNKNRLFLLILSILSIFSFIFIIYKSYKISKLKKDPDNVALIKKADGIVKITDVENETEVRSLEKEFYKGDEDFSEIKVIEEKVDERLYLEAKINELFDNIENVDVANNVVKEKVKTIEKIERVEKEDTPVFAAKNEESIKANTNDVLEKVIKVQLGALKTEEFAVEYTNKLLLKYPDLFKGLVSYVKIADLKDKGIFYRVQFGDFKTKEEAKSFCDKYIKITNNKSYSCIIIEN